MSFRRASLMLTSDPGDVGVALSFFTCDGTTASLKQALRVLTTQMDAGRAWLLGRKVEAWWCPQPDNPRWATGFYWQTREKTDWVSTKRLCRSFWIIIHK